MQYIKKDITTVTRGIVAHGVNCKGVMGGGVALAIRNKWPPVFDLYASVKPSPDLLGQCQLVPVTSDVWVANCFTQIAYGRDPNVKYASPHAIKRSLREAFAFAAADDKPLYLPPIGCGLGGLSWNIDVRNIVEELEKEYEVEVFVCDI